MEFVDERLPGWEDVVPIPQDDGPTPVVAIAYTRECETFCVISFSFHNLKSCSSTAHGCFPSSPPVRRNESTFSATVRRYFGGKMVPEQSFSILQLVKMPTGKPRELHRVAVQERMS